MSYNNDLNNEFVHMEVQTIQENFLIDFASYIGWDKAENYKKTFLEKLLLSGFDHFYCKTIMGMDVIKGFEKAGKHDYKEKALEDLAQSMLGQMATLSLTIAMFFDAPPIFHRIEQMQDFLGENYQELFHTLSNRKSYTE